MDRESGEGERVKVLFLGRHGQGWHNIAESKYGTNAWDVCYSSSPLGPRREGVLTLGQCYWSMLDGADGITWADAVLTEVGQGQAKDVNQLWKEQLPKGMPAPETYYVSPLTRTIQTADLSFKGLPLPAGSPYQPHIKEVSEISQHEDAAC